MTTIHIKKALSLLFLLFIICYCSAEQQEESKFLRGNQSNSTSIESQEFSLLTSLSQRMKPQPILYNTSTSQPLTHQFYHLHHMKSGGTSLSGWIRCGSSRADPHIPTASLSECSQNFYNMCLTENKCRERFDKSSFMNYCSPLAVVNYFGWNNHTSTATSSTRTRAVTMMRHPVHRVWSMFRFQTKSCFHCKNLTQVYQDIDDGNIEEYGDGICLPQLQNHITRNLQKNINVHELDLIELSDEERVKDAIDSIQNSFTVVGVIERLQETIELMTYSFPWLAEEIEGSDKTCPFPHSNGSPSNNRCLDGQHWDLPDEPDEETRKAIEEHNQLDIMVYEAALQHFELQKLAMVMDDTEDME